MMRSFLTILGVIAAGILGGMLGWSAGVAMDRFRGLGLGPEEFWHTDPENVWAWGFIVGGAVGIVAGVVGSVWWLRKPAKNRATAEG